MGVPAPVQAVRPRSRPATRADSVCREPRAGWGQHDATGIATKAVQPPGARTHLQHVHAVPAVLLHQDARLVRDAGDVCQERLRVRAREQALADDN